MEETENVKWCVFKVPQYILFRPFRRNFITIVNMKTVLFSQCSYIFIITNLSERLSAIKSEQNDFDNYSVSYKIILAFEVWISTYRNQSVTSLPDIKKYLSTAFKTNATTDLIN